MAFGNLKKGFIDNGNPGSLVFERNTAWDNGDVGYNMKSSSSKMNNNIAASNDVSQVSLISSVKQSGNSWNDKTTWNDKSFKSTDSSVIKGARGSDGRVKASDFLICSNGKAMGATTKEKI